MSETIYYMDTNNGNDIPVPASELGGGGGINIEETNISQTGEITLKKTVGELFEQYGEFWPANIIIGILESGDGFQLFYPVYGLIAPVGSVTYKHFGIEGNFVLEWNPDNTEDHPVLNQPHETTFNVPDMGEPSYEWNAPSWVVDKFKTHSGTLYFLDQAENPGSAPHYYIDFSRSPQTAVRYLIDAEYNIEWSDESLANNIIYIQTSAGGATTVKVTDYPESGIEYNDYSNAYQ